MKMAAEPPNEDGAGLPNEDGARLLMKTGRALMKTTKTRMKTFAGLTDEDSLRLNEDSGIAA